MRIFLNAIKELPHAEERPKGASRSTHCLAAALFDRNGQFPDSRFRGGDELAIDVMRAIRARHLAPLN
jgi:hypothetical protein